MVKITVLKAYKGAEGFVKPGEVFDVSPARAKDLILRRLAVGEIGGEMGAAGNGSVDPTNSDQPGGQTGEDNGQSSSPVVPVPESSETPSRPSRRKGTASKALTSKKLSKKRK